MQFTFFRHVFQNGCHVVRQGFLKHRINLLLSCVALLAFLLSSCASAPSARRSGPWNITELSKKPTVTWGVTDGLVQELCYEGEPLNGKPTRVFAYLGRPSEPSKTRRPAMVLVHGGGGKAFKEWAEHWAKRGYVAIAMDLAGNGKDGRLPDGGPDQADGGKFGNLTEATAHEMWTYHAVAAAIRANSLLRSLPDVDPERIGVTGISWGGYLTCIIAGIDPRLKVAVPVYGCGFLGDNSVWKEGSLARMSPESRALWLKLFDPSAYLGNVNRPILFVNGTSDFAYPLDSYQKSYQLVPAKFRHVSIAVNRPHGHIWTFPEVDAFVDSVLDAKPPLVGISAPTIANGELAVQLDRVIAPKEVSLCYTTDSGVWQNRNWLTVPAQLQGQRLSASLPSTRPLVAFLALTDENGCHISSEHIKLAEEITSATK